MPKSPKGFWGGNPRANKSAELVGHLRSPRAWSRAAKVQRLCRTEPQYLAKAKLGRRKRYLGRWSCGATPCRPILFKGVCPSFLNSFLYWLLRGDTRFYLYSDLWKPQDWINWLFENYSYLVAFPLVFIFALMLRPTRKISFALICLVTMIVFVAVGEGRIFVVRQTGNLLAMRDFKCTFGHIDQVTTKYAPDLIARQLAYKINNDSFKANQFFAPLFVNGTNLVLAAQIKSEAQLDSNVALIIICFSAYTIRTKRR
jgi:hypothetical protein